MADIEQEARAEAVQANEIAYTVIEVAQNRAPREFVTLDFRYGIADALWDAGYRKVTAPATREAVADLVEGARMPSGGTLLGSRAQFLALAAALLTAFTITEKGTP